jgi:hypothetical protein
MPNAALMFSGGIDDWYYTDLCKNITYGSIIKSKDALNYFNVLKRQYNVSDYIPTLDELFEILKYSSDNHNLLGCYALNVIT